jgi:hypothetical protein
MKTVIELLMESKRNCAASVENGKVRVCFTRIDQEDTA